jgi:RNA polymerase sigma-70 factor (ECF subfamily)
MTDLEILQEKIQDLVNKELPEKCRNIFILSRIEGKTNAEIADILSLSIRTVENQIYRALKILKKYLKNYI